LRASLSIAFAALGLAVSSPGLVVHGSRAYREVALTFDADMTYEMLDLLHSGRVASFYDPEIVRELRATRTPATVFMTGLWAQRYRDAARSIAHDPLFEVGNHSFDHAAWQPPCYGLPLVGAIGKRGEVLRAADAITRVTRVPVRWFRFPGGCHNASDVALVRSLGETPVQWDVVSGDAFLHDPAYVAHLVVAGARPGSIVVMHLMGPPRTPATAGALRILIPALRARGYRFVTLSQLLRHGSVTGS
jgi:peptidoglycan/xylan/chitin deacetylase (PgdA/CDA1 family)